MPEIRALYCTYLIRFKSIFLQYAPQGLHLPLIDSTLLNGVIVLPISAY